MTTRSNSLTLWLIAAIVASISYTAALAQSPAGDNKPADQPTKPEFRVLVVVDMSVLPHIADELKEYFALIRTEFPVDFKVLGGIFYTMPPAGIRMLLHREYNRAEYPVRGAIMIGPLPHAVRGKADEILVPAPLYYEDFDAEWIDADKDGAYEEVRTDRVNNPTEIWTTWWVPPSNDRDEQAQMIKAFLQKLIRYHRGEITGRDQMLWLAGNVINVELCEGWTVLLKDTMQPLDQKLRIWCRIGQDEGTIRPNKRAEEFGPGDFVKALTMQPWQHVHISTHGNPRGFYWGNTGVVGARYSEDRPEWSRLLKMEELKGTCGNIVTTSGCSNGNFRGAYIGPEYDKSIGNLLLFSPDTITVSYYGSASPQSTGGFGGFATELIESLGPDAHSYIAQGYFNMRNHDYSWGTQHYFFRGGDEKILMGDPFARYRPSEPPANEPTFEEKVSKTGWTVTGPG